MSDTCARAGGKATTHSKFTSVGYSATGLSPVYASTRQVLACPATKLRESHELQGALTPITKPRDSPGVVIVLSSEDDEDTVTSGNKYLHIL